MDYIDMLSRLGAGSAHPGGFSASIEQFSNYPLPAAAKILEVGCGTGRTSCYLAEQGYDVTAIEVHIEMLAKAKKRAAAMGLNVAFIQSDACEMPFPEQHFDVIVVESVTNFTHADKSIAEYYRVLKPGGILYDREIFLRKSLPEERYQQLTSFFGMPKLMNETEWVTLLNQCHFRKAGFVEISTFNQKTLALQNQLPDPHQFINEGAYLDAKVLQCAAQHTQIISDNLAYLASGLIKATK